MIQKAEIRIGNYVRPDSAAVIFSPVAAIVEDGVRFDLNDRVYGFDQIEPFALSDDLISKYDFIYGRKYFNRDFFDLKKLSPMFWKDYWDFRYNNNSLKYIKYLHEAQNLFYIISGEELTNDFQE